MPEGRGTVTDQLANIIEVLQLGRKSGLLTVERGEGTTLETGKITFVSGQITDAQAGRYVGQQASNWLNTWRTCRFTFVATQASPGRQQSTDPLPFAWQQRNTQPLLRAQTPQPITESNPRIAVPRFNTISASGVSIPQRLRPAHEALPLLETTGLSRLHRHLFLLIDGSRTNVELARLVAKRQEDVQSMLLDLERIGLISKREH
ncbi:MAG TPA: DUF4388 domain-containing protein [Ktedonobacteraceae bacterium]|jgi:hypothetical protein|nr:DUF4388 domain-containing protein [Ktedonobacteraceae bacterium]